MHSIRRHLCAVPVFTVLATSTACKPPAPVQTPVQEDAPPSGRAAMGARPAEAPAPPPTDFARAIRVDVKTDAPTGKVTALVHLEPGFHAYGPGDPTGRPLAFEVSTAGFTLENVTVPAGVEKDLGVLGKSRVVTGDVEATATVKGPAGTPAEGRFHYQVCSDTTCDRPRFAAFRIGG